MINWEEKFRNESLEQNWCYFKKIMQELMEEHIPKTRPKEREQPLWFTKEVAESVEQKKKKWKKYKFSCTSQHYEQFTVQRNLTNGIIKKAKKEMEKNIAVKSKENPKLFWNYIRSKTKCKSKFLT